MIKFNCFGSEKCSNHIESSFNPFWSQCYEMNVSLQNLLTTNITKGIVCESFDYQQTGKHQFIGSFLVKVNSSHKKTATINNKKVQFIFLKPKWYYIINPHIDVGNNVFGKVLLGVAVFKQDDIVKGNITKEFYLPSKDKLISY